MFFSCATFTLILEFIVCHIAASFWIGHKSMNVTLKSWLGLVIPPTFCHRLPRRGPCARMKFSIGLGLVMGIASVSTVKLLQAITSQLFKTSSLKSQLFKHETTATSIIEQSDHLLRFLAINLEVPEEPEISRKTAEFIALPRGYIQDRLSLSNKQCLRLEYTLKFVR